jgi:branched-chain amino acid transport system permease protein
MTAVWRRWLPLGLLVLVASLPFWFIQSQFTLAMFTLMFIWMALGMAWNLISGFGRQVSFGHSAFFGVGAYTTALLLIRLHLTPIVGILVGGVLGGLLSLVYTIVFRLRGIYFSLATFALTLILQNLAVYFSGFTGGDVGLSTPLLGNAPGFLQFTNKLWYYYLVLGLAAVYFAVSARFHGSPLGLFVRAVGDDQDAARAAGVRALAAKVQALALSAFLTAVIGGVYVVYVTFIDPSSAFGYTVATQIALLPMAGGAGTLWGPVIGAAVLYPLQQELNVAFPNLPAEIGLMIYAAVVIVVIGADANGLYSLGVRIIRNVWARTRPVPASVDARRRAS